MRVMKLNYLILACALLLLSACGTVAVVTDHGIDVAADVPAVTDTVGSDEGSAADVKDVAETTGSDTVLPVDTVKPIDAVQPDTTGSDAVEPAEVTGDAGSDTVQPVDVADATDTVPVPFFQKIGAVAANELINANAANSNFHILDVRTSGEFNGGHIAGAQNLDIYSSSFEQDVGKLSRTGIFLVYCASGSRSPGAIRTMQGLDFLTLYELSGGISSWKNAGYTTTKD